MLLQYQQQNDLGKGGRLVAGQQRLATPVQIQLQPGVQLINPQLLQSGQTQVTNVTDWHFHNYTKHIIILFIVF